MTLRLTIGIDPGLSGAIAPLADGEPGTIHDMPTRQVGKWSEVDAGRLCAILRGLMTQHAGAWIEACIEKVGARPGDGGTSAFRFGESYGRICSALEALNIPYSRVVPQQWKREFALIGSDKDASRQLALRRFPSAAHYLQRKKDHGRAEALLLALWHENTSQRGARAA